MSETNNTTVTFPTTEKKAKKGKKAPSTPKKPKSPPRPVSPVFDTLEAAREWKAPEGWEKKLRLVCVEFPTSTPRYVWCGGRTEAIRLVGESLGVKVSYPNSTKKNKVQKLENQLAQLTPEQIQELLQKYAK